MSLRNSNEMKSVLANNLFYGNVSDELKALDTNLVVNDPQFVNIKDDHFENAFRLSRMSPALNSGIIIKEDVGSDFWGNASSSKVIPNIGAFNGQF